MNREKDLKNKMQSLDEHNIQIERMHDRIELNYFGHCG